MYDRGIGPIHPAFFINRKIDKINRKKTKTLPSQKCTKYASVGCEKNWAHKPEINCVKNKHFSPSILHVCICLNTDRLSTAGFLKFLKQGYVKKLILYTVKAKKNYDHSLRHT